MKTVKFAILSDLHAAPRSSDPKKTEVKLYSDGDGFGRHDNPLSSLHELIAQEQLKADFVVCPGDMTNRADPGALRFVWAQLHKLREMLGAKEVIATVGNHDVDSRGNEVGTIPREALMRLIPRFPIAIPALADHFWAHGFYITTIDGVRFLVLNSSFLHEHRSELDKGAVTGYTLELIRRELEQMPEAMLNVAVCHHHPHVHSELGLGPDIMINGKELLDALSNHGSWLVIHGHKHHPKVEIAQGDFRQPVVLACGSFSGRIEGENATVSHNYFHMLEAGTFGEDHDLRGVIQSYSWTTGIGWQDYGTANKFFPSRVGFGSSTPPPQLAREVDRIMGTRPFMSWAEVVASVPDLAHLLPRALKAVHEQLSSRHQISITCADNGLPAQLGRRPE
ncbi:metallophosphoesterase [Paraburkholderia sp. JPY432]|uniref:metallophosphoesterase family protein n=1 Tax=Paraburkholderia youngii TaxID=2782701 RepID=UPI001595B5E1|nr:metallophosphoesterase [Paraburkholderia youngii]NVH75792.1 metallophosphoesterase [Paraburkholderia youngii]